MSTIVKPRHLAHLQNSQRGSVLLSALLGAFFALIMMTLPSRTMDTLGMKQLVKSGRHVAYLNWHSKSGLIVPISTNNPITAKSLIPEEERVTVKKNWERVSSEESSAEEHSMSGSESEDWEPIRRREQHRPQRPPPRPQNGRTWEQERQWAMQRQKSRY